MYLARSRANLQGPFGFALTHRRGLFSLLHLVCVCKTLFICEICVLLSEWCWAQLLLLLLYTLYAVLIFTVLSVSLSNCRCACCSATLVWASCCSLCPGFHRTNGEWCSITVITMVSGGGGTLQCRSDRTLFSVFFFLINFGYIFFVCSH